MRSEDCHALLRRARNDTANKLVTASMILIDQAVIARIRQLAETKQSPGTERVSLSSKHSRLNYLMEFEPFLSRGLTKGDSFCYLSTNDNIS